ncbi:MAG: class IV adenylate cyclase [Candidatus Heimdallarchaeota archaeon]|nr:MAG: class IV adenylate cyclase [Candidatus Heimdallarchaeota archaeon]
MVHINIEFKAQCNDPEKIKKILTSRNADYKGLDRQVDTYFKVNTGRLKLREGDIEKALIFYSRKDTKEPKQSNVTLFPVDSNSSTLLKEILVKSLGVLVIVSKQRSIYFIDNIKFHIDTVEELGSFVEVEAIDINGTIGVTKLQEECQFFLKLFEIPEEDLISTSYSDLLLKKLS